MSGKFPGPDHHHAGARDEVRQERLHREPGPVRPLPLCGHDASHPGESQTELKSSAPALS